jgi:hypothetical protein
MSLALVGLGKLHDLPGNDLLNLVIALSNLELEVLRRSIWRPTR